MAAAVAGAPATAEAQYVGPAPAAPWPPASVAELLANPVDDQQVILQGRILRQVGNEKYVFSDGTGEVRVDIRRENFAAVQIDETTVIRIVGEVEKDFLKAAEIDVKAFTVVSSPVGSD
jgi:uncharacterized protein (TIGR00156 family)